MTLVPFPLRRLGKAPQTRDVIVTGETGLLLDVHVAGDDEAHAALRQGLVDRVDLVLQDAVQRGPRLSRGRANKAVLQREGSDCVRLEDRVHG